MKAAQILEPARRQYRGVMTNPERWSTWNPREGDILVCTPAKCGTTWTQTIIASLLAGGTILPGPVPVISPWIDVDLGDSEDVAQGLAAQKGRRVVKTHTPGDGFPIWKGVHVVAVYRHPLDVFLSLRKHGQNMKARPDHPMKRDLEACLTDYLSEDIDDHNVDNDSLALLTEHFLRTVTASRRTQITVLHYSDMIADHSGTVRRLADDLNIDADENVIEMVRKATEFGAMKAQASNFVPEGGKGLWRDDAAFFDTGGTEKWRGAFSDPQLQRYADRFEALITDAALRAWLEQGSQSGREIFTD